MLLGDSDEQRLKLNLERPPSLGLGALATCLAECASRCSAKRSRGTVSATPNSISSRDYLS